MVELDRVTAIYSDMGFNVMESTQLDDEFHMFDSLNFAKEHPARDGYDTFRTRKVSFRRRILRRCSIVPSKNTSVS